jgi:hypothetical protein
MFPKLTALIAGVTVAAALVLAPLPSGAAAPPPAAVPPAATGGTPTATPDSVPPPEPSHLATLAAVMAYTTGKRVGPSADTGNGYFTITGFHRSGNGWVRERTAVSYANPTIVAGGANTGGPGSSVTPSVMHPNSWYDPSSWNWKHILGSAWDATWNGCLKGSLTGLVGAAGGTLMVNMIARAGKIVPGPYGYAAIAISGCLVAALNY